MGEKTAAKLIGQFGSVERLYENLSLVPGKLRETLAANRKQALLSRELATVSTRVPIDGGSRGLPAPGAGLGAAARALDRARVPQPAAPAPRGPRAAATAAATPDPRRRGRRSRGYLARVPAGEPLAVDWVGEGGPPEPDARRRSVSIHPAAGDAVLDCAGPDRRAAGFGGRAR